MKKIPLIEKECPNCKIVFLAKKSEIKRGGGIYCGRKCMGVYTQKNGGKNTKTLTMRHKGYILGWAPTHPKNVKGYVYQHRLIMEKKLGRYLTRDEIVHHNNEIKDDNRLKNLQVMTKKEHLRHHKGTEVILDGHKMFYSDAISELGIAPSSVKRYRKIYKKTKQESIDHYAKGTAKFERRSP